jgi:hypothetical protein
MMKTDKSKEELYESALQEAAHAVVAGWLRFRVNHVELTPSGGRCHIDAEMPEKIKPGYCAQTPQEIEEEQDWLWRYGIFAMAGVAASVVYRGDYFEGWGFNEWKVMDILSVQATEGPTYFVLTCFKVAEKCLLDNWKTVEAIAQVLMEHGQLTGHNLNNMLGNMASSTSTNTGRNDPCPCGSGKKFKHCCMS